MKKKYIIPIVLFMLLCLCVGCSGVMPEKPEDTTLEFWIAEDVSSVDFSGYYKRAGVFGANEYYGYGYSPAEITDGNMDILPQHYVIYTVSGYPDTSDPWHYVTRIQITDPQVRVYGLTCDSSLEEFDETMTEFGYTINDDNDRMHTATLGKVRIVLVSHEETNNRLSIHVEVTNKHGIVY